jgi:uncharacterized protein (TIGR02118 family)
MVKLVALYRKPEDVTAFEEHYSNVHLPLMEKVPGIAKTRLTRFFAGPLGEPAYYMMFEAFFPDRAALDAALQSPENRAAGKDLMSFARDIVTVMFGDAFGEDL